MKNLWIIPTDKPSRLYTNRYGEYRLHNDLSTMPIDSIGSNQHIYITNDEEIKEWYIYKGELLRASLNHSKYAMLYGKPIILTTDPDLIKDGVQDIDNEFLEWFVKNPSCEEVPIITTTVNNESIYKTNIGFELWRKEEPKQETLEEAAERYCEKVWGGYKDDVFKHDDIITDETLSEISKKDFTEGAKWQAERMYSKEEVIAIVEKSRITGLTAEYLMLTEQFKKK